MLCRYRHNSHLIRTPSGSPPASTGRAQAGPGTDPHRRQRHRDQGDVRRPGQEVGQRYPAVVRLWDNAWAEFVPFLDYDVEIRTVHEVAVQHSTPSPVAPA